MSDTQNTDSTENTEPVMTELKNQKLDTTVALVVVGLTAGAALGFGIYNYREILELRKAARATVLLISEVEKLKQA